jgi:hypothetical protein
LVTGGERMNENEKHVYDDYEVDLRQIVYLLW